ncbi:hypothetical protein AKJ16_DCAP11861 [Drosera capensis]
MKVSSSSSSAQLNPMRIDLISSHPDQFSTIRACRGTAFCLFCKYFGFQGLNFVSMMTTCVMQDKGL